MDVPTEPSYKTPPHCHPRVPTLLLPPAPRPSVTSFPTCTKPGKKARNGLSGLISKSQIRQPRRSGDGALHILCFVHAEVREKGGAQGPAPLGTVITDVPSVESHPLNDQTRSQTCFALCSCAHTALRGNKRDCSISREVPTAKGETDVLESVNTKTHLHSFLFRSPSDIRLVTPFPELGSHTG